MSALQSPSGCGCQEGGSADSGYCWAASTPAVSVAWQAGKALTLSENALEPFVRTLKLLEVAGGTLGQRAGLGSSLAVAYCCLQMESPGLTTPAQSKKAHKHFQYC